MPKKPYKEVTRDIRKTFRITKEEEVLLEKLRNEKGMKEGQFIRSKIFS